MSNDPIKPDASRVNPATSPDAQSKTVEQKSSDKRPDATTLESRRPIQRPTETTIQPETRARDNFDMTRMAPIAEMADRHVFAVSAFNVAGRQIQDFRQEHAAQRERPHEREGHREHDHDHDHNHRRAEGRSAHAKRPGVAEENPEVAAAIKKAHGALDPAEGDVKIIGTISK